MKLIKIFAVAEVALGVSLTFASATTVAADAQSVLDKLNEFGPQAQALVQRTGTWDVTITSWENQAPSLSFSTDW